MVMTAAVNVDTTACKPVAMSPPGHERHAIAQYAAVVLLGVAGYSMAAIKPLVITSYVADFGLSTRVAGYVLGAEMISMAVGVLLAAALMARTLGRRYVLLALLIILVGDVGSIVSGTGLALYGFRVLAGLGHGFALGRLAAAIAAFKHPDRASGIYTVCSKAYAAAFAFLLPTLQWLLGPGALFTIGVVAAVAALGTLRWLPVNSTTYPVSSASGTQRVVNRLPFRTLALVGVAASFYYLSIGVYWAFVGQFSASTVLDSAAKTRIIGWSSLIGILGASISIIVSDRFGRFGLITGLLGLQLISVASLFFAGESIPQYALSLWAYLFAWLALFPYLLGLMSRIDPIGRLNGLLYGVTSVAFAVGPIFSGWLIGHSATERLGLDRVQEVSFVLMLVAAGLLICLAGRYRELPPQYDTASSF